MYLEKLVLARSISEDFIESICLTLFRNELESYCEIEFEEVGAEFRTAIRDLIGKCLGSVSVRKYSAVG